MTAPVCTNIADYLVDMARRQPHTLAVVFPDGVDHGGRVRYTHYTYAQLDRESDGIAAGLLREGIGRGTRVALMTPPSLDFFALVFALFKVGAVLVAVDPGLGIKHLARCLAEAAPEAFIGIPKAHWARKILGWARNSVKKNVVVGSGPATWMCGLRLNALRMEDGGSRIEGQYVGQDSSVPQSSILHPQSSDLAAILFTSGSTGAPKGVVYTHGHFDAQLRALRDAFDIRPGEIDLATFPLFALYGPALGMTAIVPEMDFTRPGSVDPTKIARAIDDFGVTNLFGSPALLDRVSRWGAESGEMFPTLRRVISAGAPVPARVIERMTRMLSPGVQVFTPYGATESIPVASIGSDEILGETARRTEQGAGVCVGRPVGDVVVRVIHIRDDAIDHWSDDLLAPPGETGEIVVSGPAVTAKYHARDEATRLAKIADESRPSGFWHRMGDLGYFDAYGRIWFCGRKSQRVRLATGDLYTDPCEGVFNVHPDVRRSALVGIGENGRARPVLCVELVEAPQRTPEDIREELLKIGAGFEHARQVRDVLFHPSFPVDIRHNAKIGREALAKWAAGKLG
jgi:olefin beta-lactone synthetase